MRFFWSYDVELFKLEEIDELAPTGECFGVVTPMRFTYFGVSISDWFFGITRAVWA